MENAEECAKDDGNQLSRNRSLKSKQLVRSQAIRESTSPPRTISPSFQPPYQAPEYIDRTSPYQATNNRTLSPADRTSPSYHATSEGNLSPCPPYHVTPATDRNPSPNGRPPYQATSNGRHQVIATESSQDDYDKCDKRKTVEIQITGGGCNNDAPYCDRRERVSCDARLLSQTPRTACVCGACANCPQCRGKRRKDKCPTKQDSGIVCPDDCPDCSDTEHNGVSNTETRKSLDVDDQFYCRCPERRDKPKSIPLNRSDSDDKQEPSGPELVNFLKETLNKNSRDRVTLLRIEKELHSLVNDNGRCIVKFPVMSSYGRMLVHRCASLFQLSHFLDQFNKNCVVVSKTGTSGGCIPCTSFRAWCVSSFPPSPRHHADSTLTRSILKRDTHSLDEPSPGSLAMNRSKSLEQREKEYERVRRRIFSSDNCTQDESQWPWLNSGPVKLLAPDPARNKLLKVQSLEGQPCQAGSWRKSGSVSKSHSFGGYVEHSRTLSRQGDLASSSWRLSPSSSGYKTLSLRSTDSVTPSPTGGGTPEPPYTGAGAVVWAVTDMSAVPPGALVIHPQTGRPLTNPDGTVYHFDPNNPPQIYDASAASATYMHHSQIDNKIDLNNEKRRGRLEKQHSFIDNDSECQQTEDCRNKCCCECSRHENQAKPQDQEQQKPATPIKNRYDQPPPESTNHSNHEPEPANQNQPHLDQQPIAECETNPINQRQFDNQQRSYETNQRKVEMQENIVYGNYNQGYSEEMTSPSQMAQYIQPGDMMAMNNMNLMQAAKYTSTPLHDPNIRPVSLTNMVYGQTIPPAYYIPNHCRMDQIQQPLYQPLQQMEEPKHHQQQQETAFRIDPSYPYAPLEYAACACAGTETQQPQRSYSVYNQSDVGGLSGVGGMAAGAGAAGNVAPYPVPVHNVLLSQVMPQYPVQYQEPMQWLPAATPKLIDMNVCPVVYPHQYAHYNILYPQMVPQSYPYCPPTVPQRPSHPPSRNTPRAAPPLHGDKHGDNMDDDIQTKITQIKDQMAAMNMKLGTTGGGATGRNSGNGILGSHPAQAQHTHQHAINGTRHNNLNHQEDTAQLSSAARAIVNSIRNMQAKSTYQEKPYDHTQRTDRRTDRHDAERKLPYRQPYLFRQMSPGAWCRRSPAPVHPVMNHPRRPHPDSRNFRR